MGEPSALGVIPQFANELYDRIEGTADEETSYKVEVSYYEIYKERIHDLLASTKHKSKTHLRVREHPVTGPYVEDLSTYVASSFADVERWLALGNRFRATAATGMNDRSSRSHSVFTLVLTQTKIIEGEDHTRVSRINLIDLAGSERSAISMTSGERLKVNNH
ncbi:PREDICTED: kinesin-like protein KIF14 [Amphimedon queenslandica]|nr:PREDICTED: kinesin-like protein KIF14 [Amphimedon queenslandica]|eukprot:XP_019863160.1 PREDICTED: kinesin-like protein KIF14 [Amphimedon queenslandica]